MNLQPPTLVGYLFTFLSSIPLPTFICRKIFLLTYGPHISLEVGESRSFILSLASSLIYERKGGSEWGEQHTYL